MKKKLWSKRLLSMVLALCMLCSVMPVMAVEGEEQPLGSEANPVTAFADLQTVLDAASGTASDPAEVYISGLMSATASIKIREGDFIKLIGTGAGESGLKRDASMVQVGNTKPGELIEVQTGGYLELEDVVLDGGAVWSGGASGTNSGIKPGDSGLFAVRKDAEAILLDGTVLRNNEKGGGGGAIWLVGTLTIDGASIENNKANGTGGAIVVRNDYSKLYIESGSFTGNYATGDGGAIYIQDRGLVEMSGGSITNNSTANDMSGGAVRVRGTFKMTGGEISGNSAGNSGGAIYLSSTPAVLELTGGEITDNIARKTKSDGNGGAINANTSGQVIEVGGSVEIVDNYLGSGNDKTENNISIKDNVISLAVKSTLTGEVSVVAPGVGAVVATKDGNADLEDSLEHLSVTPANDAYALVVDGDNIVYNYAVPTIELDPEKEDYEIGEEVTVTLTAKQDGAALYYKLDDAAEWTAYEAPFTVTADSAKTVKVSAYAAITVDEETVDTAVVEDSVVFAEAVYTTFDKLEEAIKAAKGTAQDPEVLYVKGMINAPRKLYLVGDQHIKLVGVGEGENGLERGETHIDSGDMIDVGNNVSNAVCSLVLENFILDGGAVWSDGAGSTNSGFKPGNSSLMSIRNKASAVLGEGSILRNNEKGGTGAAIYSKGKLTIAGGVISGCYSNGGDGGAVYMNDDGAVTFMTGGKIIDNAASSKKSGGAVRVKGTFTMTGGEISGNSAGNSGGAIYINAGSVNITGGTITKNTALADNGGNGGAIYYNGAITVGGSANITGNYRGTGNDKAENNIYLNGKTLTLDSTLTGTVSVVNPTVGHEIAVKSGAADLAASLDNFKLDTEDANYELAVSGDYIIMQAKQLSPFEKLEKAIKEAAGTAENPVVIEVNGMIEAPRKLVLNHGQHIKLVGVGESENGLIRAANYDSGDMIDVGNNDNSKVASLVLENIVIDGGKNAGASPMNSSLVSVRGAATVTLGEGTILRNNVKSGGGSAVWIVGTLIVDGGKIIDNETSGSNNGGGVYLRNPESVLVMKAGEISGNKAGGSSGGGVQVNNQGTVQIAGGKITGNTADGVKNNVAVNAGSVEITGTMQTGDLIGLTLSSMNEGALVATLGDGVDAAALTAALDKLALDKETALKLEISGSDILIADTSTGCGCEGGFVKGNGQPATAYQITTAAQLAHMAEHVGSSFKLMGDIAVSDWMPVALDGEFNGNGFTVSGLDNSLFSMIGEEGKVYDVTLDGAITPVKADEKVGGLAGESAGEIDNVTSNVSITIPATADKDAMFGGIVGYSTGTVCDSKYTGTITDARANSGSYVGEIIGCSAYESAEGLPTMVTAHAGFAAPGGPGDGSEDNTLSNMIKAVNYGADAIEVDVVMSNGVLMLSHGTGALHANSPTLVESMQLLMGTHARSNELNANGATVRIQFDSKQNGILDEILAAIEAQNFPWERVILAGDNSYDHVSANMDKIRYGVSQGMDFWMNPNFILSYAAMDAMNEEFIDRIEAFNLPTFTVNSSNTNMTPAVQEWLESHGLNVSVWTLNDSATINRFITRGVYNTTSRLLECLETRNLLRDGVLGNTYGEDWPQIGSYVPNGVNLYVVDFEIPGGASIVVTDESGNVVAANPDGSYTLEEGETYTYTVTKSGYKSVSGTITEANEDETIAVSLKKKTSSSASSTPSKSDKETAEVEDLIDEIGKVTLADQERIEEAREAYDALSAAEKRKVENYEELLEAEKQLAELLAAEIELPFTDVDEDDPCYEAVKFMYANGLMVGIGDGTQFAPEMGLSRAMIAQILHMFEEEPEAVASNFSDVVRGFWYSDAIDWATAKGVISGYGNGKFGPNDTLTREQLAVMLYQYAISRGWEIDHGDDLEHPDRHTVSHWAADAMQWAIHNGILTENGVGYLAAGDPATRADVAEAVMALVQLYA